MPSHYQLLRLVRLSLKMTVAPSHNDGATVILSIILKCEESHSYYE